MAKSIWKENDPDTVVGQGDLLIIAWTKTIAPDQARFSDATYPIPGVRDGLDLRLWDDRRRPDILEMWGRATCGLAVVVSEGCAIDKEFNVLRAKYVDEGLDPEEAAARAQAEEEGFIAVAEVWPVDALPEHLRDGALSGAIGYLPFTMGNLVPEDKRSWVVDLSRVATVNLRSVHERIGIADSRWVLKLQSAICRYFAARTIRVSENLADLFQQQVIQVEALTVPTGDPPRVRARVHFEGGRKVDLEAILTEVTAPDAVEARRQGFRGRK